MLFQVMGGMASVVAGEDLSGGAVTMGSPISVLAFKLFDLVKLLHAAEGL